MNVSRSPFESRPIRTFFIGRDDQTGSHALMYEERASVLAQVTESRAHAANGAIDIFAVTGAIGESGRQRVQPKTMPNCTDGCHLRPPGCVGCVITQPLRALYRELLQQAQYAWHLSGDTESASRLYDIIAAGAVPIVLSSAKNASLPATGASMPFADLLLRVEMVVQAAGTSGTGIDAALLLRELDEQRGRGARAAALIAAHAADLLWWHDPPRVACNVLRAFANRGRSGAQKWSCSSWHHKVRCMPSKNGG